MFEQVENGEMAVRLSFRFSSLGFGRGLASETCHAGTASLRNFCSIN